MVKVTNPRNKFHQRSRGEQLRIRAGLMMVGHSIKSFAAHHGVSDVLVCRLITGVRPGVRGKSAKLKQQLEQLAA